MADPLLILPLEVGDILPDGTVLTVEDTLGWYAVGLTDGNRYVKHRDSDDIVYWDNRGQEG